MTDIVEQLRNYGLSHLKGTPSVIAEATDEIERQRARAEAAEKRVKELEPIVTMREQELMGELVRERGLVQASHKRETAMRDLLMRFIPAERHDEVRAALEAKP